MLAEKPHPHLRSFGRRRGHKLRPTKQSLIDTLLPKVEITLDELEKKQPLFPKSISSLWLEIGFGGGEHLAHQAALNPNVGIIGCEPYVNGIAGLLSAIEAQNLQNIRIFTDDARILMSHLQPASLARVFILYADPWPKTRHHKRRLISTEFLNQLGHPMQPGAELRLATDDADYAAWMLERLLPHPDFSWTAKTCHDWLNPPADWIPTRYEQKALAGRPSYLNFIRESI